MAYGVLPTGFATKSVEVLKSELDAALAAEFPGVNLSAESLFGQLNGIMASKLGEQWQNAQALASNLDPSTAIGRWLRFIGLFTGVTPLPARKSFVTLSCYLYQGYTLPLGSVIQSNTNASVRFVTRAAVTNSGVSAALFSVEADAEVFGPVAALANTLTIAVSPAISPTALITVTNPTDATLGAFAESDFAFRARLAAETAGQGLRVIDAIRASVLAVDGVVSVHVRENTLDIAVGAMAPKSVSVTIYDGTSPQAANAEVAQAILDAKGFGIYTNGSVVQTATDSEGQSHTVRFSRATILPMYARIRVRVSGGASVATQVAQAIVEFCDANLQVGDDVIVSQLCKPIFSIADVVDVVNTYVGIAPNPSSEANYEVSESQIADFDTSRITVEIVP